MGHALTCPDRGAVGPDFTKTEWRWANRLPGNFPWILLLIFCACGRTTPDALYNRIEKARRAGDLPAALADARKGSDAWGADPSSPWHWSFRLIAAEILLMQGNAKEALPLIEKDAPAQLAGRDGIQARILKDRGYAAVTQSQWSDAIAALTRLHDDPAAAGILPEILISRGTARARNGEPALAEADYREAVAAAGRARDPYWQASAIGSIGFLRLVQSRYDESIEWLERSLAIADREGYQGIRGKIIGNAGWCYFQLGDLDRAATNFAENEKFNARSGNRRDQQITLGHIANIAWMNGEYQAALAQYQKALTIAESVQDVYYTATWLNNIASSYLEMKRIEDAEPYITRSLALRAQSKDPSEKAPPLLLSAEAAVLRKEYQRAIKIYREAMQLAPSNPRTQWSAHEGLGVLYAAAGSPARARQEFEQAVATIDANWSALTSDQSKLTFPGQLHRLYQRYIDILMTQGLTEQALTFAESRRAKLLAEKLGEGKPTPFRDIARQLNAVLMSYWLAPDQSYLWITTPTQLRAVKLPAEYKIRNLVDTYAKSIQDRRPNSAARELFDILIDPVRDLLPSNARIILVPDGPLHKLNFETLMPATDRYWIEDVSIEIAPSLRLLDRAPRPTRKTQSILLIGDPVQADPPLPFAKEEIGGISQMFPDRAQLIGPDARPESYRAAAPQKFSLIHFAAHAVANRESPLDSAVVLSPGKDGAKLYAREVQQVPLAADLVTISACRSSGARDYSGEGRVGFAWAFLSAGARNVIATLWDVNDQSTSAFMQSFYARLQKNEPPASALRAVKLEFLKRQKPYYWAPFQIYVR